MNAKFIQRCYELAQQSVNQGNHPFGALLVKDGEIVLEAENTTVIGTNPLHHAETNLLNQAFQKYSGDYISQCTLYTSTEPCAMCSGAIYWSGISQVVYGCSALGLKEVTKENFLVPCQNIFQGSRNVNIIGPVDEKTGRKMHDDFWPDFFSK